MCKPECQIVVIVMHNVQARGPGARGERLVHRDDSFLIGHCVTSTFVCPFRTLRL
jgi:hypothetical protein